MEEEKIIVPPLNSLEEEEFCLNEQLACRDRVRELEIEEIEIQSPFANQTLEE